MGMSPSRPTPRTPPPWGSLRGPSAPPIQDSDSQLIPGATPGLIAALTALSKHYAHPQLELCAGGWAVRMVTPLAVAVSMLSRLEPGEGLSEQLLEEAGRAVLDVDAAPAAAVS